MTSEIPVTQAREELADLINRVAYGHERIVLTRHSRPVAVIVPPADLAVIEEQERQSERGGEGRSDQAQPSAGEDQPSAGITYIGLGSDPGSSVSGGSIVLDPAARTRPSGAPGAPNVPATPGAPATPEAPTAPTAPGTPPVTARHRPPGKSSDK